MSIRRSLLAALATVATSGLLLGAITAPAAQAYDLEIMEGICAISFDKEDKEKLKVQEGLEIALLDSYWALHRDIPLSDVHDIAAITNHVFNNWGKRDFTSARDFRGTQVNGAAQRVNNAAKRAGFRNNEIFDIVRFQYSMSLTVATEAATMRGSHFRPDGEPLLITTSRATHMVEELRLINLVPRGQFSTKAQRNIDLLASDGYEVLEKAYEPIIRCAGGTGGPGVGGGATGSSLSS